MRLPPGAGGWPGFTSPSVPGIVSSCPRASLLSSVRMSRPLLPGRLLPCNAFPRRQRGRGTGPAPSSRPRGPGLVLSPAFGPCAGQTQSVDGHAPGLHQPRGGGRRLPLAAGPGARVRGGIRPVSVRPRPWPGRQAWKRPCGRWACGWSPWPIPVRWSCPCAGAGPFPSGWPGWRWKATSSFPCPGSRPIPRCA